MEKKKTSDMPGTNNLKPTAKPVPHKPFEDEPHGHGREGSLIRQIILGGQDGLVNVLGLALGVAAATYDVKIIVIAGLAATSAESISMAAVAYTSSKAAKDSYYSELEREKQEIREFPEVEREEVRLIYMKKGFRGRTLEEIVKKICSNETAWLDIMMSEELGLKESKHINPKSEALLVGASSVIGSLVPLIPFFLVSAGEGIIYSLVLSAIVLFSAGAYVAKTTNQNMLKRGLEMFAIGMVAAFVGYIIGIVLGTTI